VSIPYFKSELIRLINNVVFSILALLLFSSLVNEKQGFFMLKVLQYLNALIKLPINGQCFMKKKYELVAYVKYLSEICNRNVKDVDYFFYK